MFILLTALIFSSGFQFQQKYDYCKAEAFKPDYCKLQKSMSKYDK